MELNTVIKDPVTLYLVERFKSLEIPSNRWRYGVGPHSHNYNSQTDRVVLQYPPGTGYTLSIFHEGEQVRSAFVRWSIIILILCVLILLRARSPVVPILSAFVGLICLFALWRCFTYPSIPGSIAISLWVAYLTVKSYIKRGS